MANRTVQIKGLGYGSGTCSASVTFNGNAVFSGAIPTIDQSTINYLTSQQQTLFEFEIPVDLDGTFPVSIEFTGGNAVFVAQVLTNFVYVPNPIYSSADYAVLISPSSTKAQKNAIYIAAAQPPLSSEDINTLENGTDQQAFQVLVANGLDSQVSAGPDVFEPISGAQAKINVVINGVAATQPSSAEGEAGEWGWTVPMVNSQGTMSFGLIVIAGTE
jgi:hypothetical protein